MRFRQFVPHSILIVLMVMALNFGLRTLQAQSDVAPNEPLTLLWQSEFTPETAIPSPGDIAVDEWGNVYVSSQVDNTIKKFDSEGNFLLEWGERGRGDGQFSLSLGLAVDAENNVYVTDFYNKRIHKFDSEGNFLLMWPNEPSTHPAFVAADAEGNVYVNEFPPFGEHYVQKFDSQGNLITEWGEESGDFVGRTEDIALDAEGNLYVTDQPAHLVRKLSPDGELLMTFGGESSREGNGDFSNLKSVSVDDAGNVYVLDGNFLQKFDAEGNFLTQWSTAKGSDLDSASNVMVDGEGNIFVFAKADVVAANGNTVNVAVLKKFQQS
jgi:tripartite motif-containing protein 71